MNRRNNMKLLCLFLIIIISSSCNQRKDIKESHLEKVEIDSILITYYPGSIESNVAIKCEKIANIQAKHPKNDYSLLSEGIVEIIDTFIVEKIILDRIQPLIERKKTIAHYNEDARMYVTVKYTNNTKDNICLGMEVSQGMFNGKAVFVENELVYLLRTYSGYYKWFDKDELSYFTELQDSTFRKSH